VLIGGEKKFSGEGVFSVKGKLFGNSHVFPQGYRNSCSECLDGGVSLGEYSGRGI